MAVKIVPKEEMLDAIGTKFEPGEWIEVTQDRINVFADCTEDHQFIHVDEEAAKNTPFGSTIAHGFLTLSLLSKMAEGNGVIPENIVMGLNYGFDKVRFLAPVKSGKRVRANAEVADIVRKDENRFLIKQVDLCRDRGRGHAGLGGRMVEYGNRRLISRPIYFSIKRGSVMSIRYDGKVAIVTGSGQGLGRSHAIELAKRGAKVVINDLGGGVDGSGGSSDAAKAVVAEIEALGGEAIANGANVAKYDEVEAMVKQAMEKWGRVDILVNNAGILRDKSFTKGSLDDFKLVLDVHLMGSVNCTKACWDIMRDQAYGRIVVTTSSSGLYGNFGQTNYGSAKMGVIGMMNTLAQEGAKYDIRINALAPTAGTRMTEGLIPEEAFALLTPETVTPAVLYMASDDAPNKTIICAGAGAYSVAKIIETDGVWLTPEDQTPEGIAANWDAITSSEGQTQPQAGFEQTVKFTGKAMTGLGLNK